MKNKLILIFLSFFALQLSAQQQGNIWYFGEKAGLDFSSGAPQLLTDGAILTFEGCASYSDENGQLLFYTNGGGRPPETSGQHPGGIWNRNHELMYDMAGEEGGGFSARQSALIIPKPGTSEEYYLFTMEEVEFNIGGDVAGQPQGRGLSFFEIDMSLNGGLGGVTVADQRIQVPLFESLSGTQHANEKDYWILSADNTGDNNRFVRLLVTEEGIQPTDFVPIDTSFSIGGSIKISPSSEWIYTGGSLFRFDNSTGDISTVVALPPETQARSRAFSPNSRYLYTIELTDTQPEAAQYDLQAADIVGSRTVFGTLPDQVIIGQMQVAPDGNLYYLESPFFNVERPLLSAITCANTDNPQLVREVIELPEGNDYTPYFGLPNFTDHLFAQDGPVLSLDLGPDTLVLCAGETRTIGPVGQLPGATYEWSTGADTPTLELSEAGTYSLTISNACESVSDTIVLIQDNGTLSVSVEGAAEFCPGETLALRAEAVGPVDSYLWSTGDSTVEITVSESGFYSVTVEGGCDGSLTANAVLEVEALSEPGIEIVADNGSEEGVFCESEPAQLSVAGSALDSLLWSTGATSEQIEVEQGADSLITVSGANACGTATDTLLLQFIDCDTLECMISIPNTFTPNGDGVNDAFGFVSSCDEPDFELYEFSVYNRWGEAVFESSRPAQAWNGTLDGNPAPSEVYFYYLRYRLEEQEEAELLQGDVTLLR